MRVSCFWSCGVRIAVGCDCLCSCRRVALCRAALHSVSCQPCAWLLLLLRALGQLGLPPDQGSCSCTKCSSSSSSLPGPPGVVAGISRLPVLEGRVVVSAAASLFNTALLTADGELYMLGERSICICMDACMQCRSVELCSVRACQASDSRWRTVHVR
jgi:hypothetical protein